MDDQCVALAERMSAMETKVEDMKAENKTFRNEIREEVREIRKQNEAIYEIASSVQLIAKDMQNIKQDISDVKDGQKKLGEKMDDEIETVKGEQAEIREKVTAVENRDANNLWSGVQKVKWTVIGAVATAFVCYVVYLVFPMLKA